MNNILHHKEFVRILPDDDIMKVTAEIKSLGGQEPYFSITAMIREPRKLEPHSAGCLHEEIAENFPELEKYIKWHLVSYKEPMHYLGNSLYAASNRDHNGLLKGEKRQIKNGKTGLSCWQMVAIDKETKEEVDLYMVDKTVDSEEKPECKFDIDFKPWCRIGEGKEPDLKAAQYHARWYNAKLEDFTEEKLLARLPKLMDKFFKDMSELFETKVQP